MAVYHRITVEGHRYLGYGVRLPEKVEIALGEVLGAAKEGLLAFSVAVGLGVLRAMMEAEVAEAIGPRGKHLSDRRAWRHGTERAAWSWVGAKWPCGGPGSAPRTGGR